MLKSLLVWQDIQTFGVKKKLNKIIFFFSFDELLQLKLKLITFVKRVMTVKNSSIPLQKKARDLKNKNKFYWFLKK